jgi:hypothetical protein
MEEISLTLPELKALFVRLKKAEKGLSAVEQVLLSKIQKALYQNLSIEEAESLLNEITA